MRQQQPGLNRMLGLRIPNPVVSTSAPIVASQPESQIVTAGYGASMMYHYVRTVSQESDPLGYRLSVSPEQLESQVLALQGAGVGMVTMDQLVANTGAPVVALTFDDGYEDVYTTAWPILKRHGATATVYIITGRVGTSGYLTWEQIVQLQSEGVQIGSHSVSHPDLSKLSPEQQRGELLESKRELERRLGATVTSFCYPSGRYSQITVALAEEVGYQYAVTTQPGVITNLARPYELLRIRVSPTTTVAQLLASVGKK